MKSMQKPNGQFGAASSTRGAPHTPRSMGQKPPAITDGGTRVKVGASAGREHAGAVDKGKGGKA